MYQADWMKRLLIRYGQDMCLMDATYRVCRYVNARNPSIRVERCLSCGVLKTLLILILGHPCIREPQKKIQQDISFDNIPSPATFWVKSYFIETNFGLMFYKYVGVQSPKTLNVHSRYSRCTITFSEEWVLLVKIERTIDNIT